MTVNDYLAKRDSKWMEPLYNFLDSVSVSYTAVSRLKRKRQRISPILPTVQIMNSALTTCVTIWPLVLN